MYQWAQITVCSVHHPEVLRVVIEFYKIKILKKKLNVKMLLWNTLTKIELHTMHDFLRNLTQSQMIALCIPNFYSAYSKQKIHIWSLTGPFSARCHNCSNYIEMCIPNVCSAAISIPNSHDARAGRTHRDATRRRGRSLAFGKGSIVWTADFDQFSFNIERW